MPEAVLPPAVAAPACREHQVEEMCNLVSTSPFGAQRRAPHRVLHHRHFSFQMHLAGELMHSYQPLGDPGPPST